MKVKPFGVRQSAPDASEHLSHLTRRKSTQLKLDRVLRPDPNGTPPDVAVLNGCVSVR
jgi:hypothetical protein